VDLPQPGWAFAWGEVVVVVARQGLEGDEGRVVLEQDGDVAGSLDLSLTRTAGDAFPAEAG
jgi:hypothetical protein